MNVVVYFYCFLLVLACNAICYLIPFKGGVRRRIRLAGFLALLGRALSLLLRWWSPLLRRTSLRRSLLLTRASWPRRILLSARRSLLLLLRQSLCLLLTPIALHRR